MLSIVLRKLALLATISAFVTLAGCGGSMAARAPLAENCPANQVRVCHHRGATRAKKVYPDYCTCEASGQSLGRVLRND